MVYILGYWLPCPYKPPDTDSSSNVTNTDFDSEKTDSDSEETDSDSDVTDSDSQITDPASEITDSVSELPDSDYDFNLEITGIRITELMNQKTSHTCDRKYDRYVKILCFPLRQNSILQTSKIYLTHKIVRLCSNFFVAL